MEFSILHDTNKTLCFIGTSYMNQQFYNYFKSSRPVELITWEDASTKSQAWFDARQFHAALSHTGFKKQVVESIAEFSPEYFSVIGGSSFVDPGAKIGKNVYVYGLSVVASGDVIIGDHTIIAAQVVVSHGSVIGEFCFVAPFGYTCFCTLGDGVAMGHRSSISGRRDNPISVAAWTSLTMNSTVTKNIDVAATYYGNRLISKENSLEKCII